MRLKNETTTQVLNNDTGELITQTVSKTYSVKTSPEQFYFTFLNMIGDYIGLKSKTDVNILCALCKYAEYNTGKVSMSTNKRKEVIEELGLTYHTFANSIHRLKDANFITDKGRDYTINPLYFWKGTLSERQKLLEGGKMSVNINFENESND